MTCLSLCYTVTILSHNLSISSAIIIIKLSYVSFTSIKVCT